MRKGFTLIELLVVGAIMLILALVVVLTFNGSKTSKDKPQTEEERCQFFKYASIKDMPAFCVKYYLNK